MGSLFLVKSALLDQTVTIPAHGGETLFVVQSRAGEQREDAFRHGELVRIRHLQHSDGAALVDIWGTVRKDEEAAHDNNIEDSPLQRWWFTPVYPSLLAQAYTIIAGTMLEGYGTGGKGYYIADEDGSAPYFPRLAEVSNG